MASLQILRDVVSFLVVLTALVFVHEMGHYLIARLNRVRVEVFSIGFGREIYGFTDRSGTRWKVGFLPLGGYVKFFGDANAVSMSGKRLRGMSAAERAVSFHHKRLGQRTAIVLAGPAANFLFAIVLFAGLFMFVGQPTTPPVVDAVTAGSAAAEAGFEPGDRIVEIDGTAIARFQDMQRIVRMSPDQALEVVVERGGAELVLRVIPRLVEIEDGFGNTLRVGQLGIANSSGREFLRHGPASALWIATTETVAISALTLQAIGEMIVGSRSTDELGGPIRIAQLSGQFCQDVVACIGFAALLSINLGLINLFPVPMLDGGHLLFYSFEALRGKPLAARLQDIGIRIGFALVIVLFIFVTWNDLVN